MRESLASVEMGSASIRETSRLAPNGSPKMVQRGHQSMQTVSISFVLLFGNLGGAAENRGTSTR